jgi:adenylyltransferase/sulfurtransferase
MLESDDQQRYLRNILLKEIGEEGQIKLLNSKVLVVGAGGLGSAILFYLSACGIGNIGIIDDDKVELSNLARQIIYNENDLNLAKVDCSKQKILALNSKLKIDSYPVRANYDNLASIAKNYDLIIDASDNFYTRFVINQTCHQLAKPMVFGAVKDFIGQVSIFKSYLDNNPCYACFNPNQVDKNFSLPISQKAILGGVAGNIGTIQAINAVKDLLNIGESLVGKILIFDFLQNNFRKTKLVKNPSCKICNDV